MSEYQSLHDAAGLAALGICESLMLAMTDLKIMREEDVRNLLTDVATAHRNADDNAVSAKQHDAVVAIIDRILASKNGVRK